jgi:hypothetical protein
VRAGADAATCFCTIQTLANIHHRFGELVIAELSRAMDDRDFIVIFQHAIPIRLEDTSHTFHPEQE